jgi:hypothetical protein
VRTVEGRLQGKTTDFEKFQEIYQYVMQQVEYEYDEYGNPSSASHVGTIVGVLDGDRRTNSVCAGYAYAITYLSNVFGVECISVANEALNHAWNMVKIDGGWYHADATNEDSNNGVDLFLCSEKVFWEFFEYPAPAYDKGEADTVGRVGIIPDVLDDLCYSRFEYKTVEGGLAVSGAIVNQYLLRIPSTYAGKKVVAIAENFTYTAGNLSDLVLPVSVVSVEFAAFSWKPLSRIFYEGTPEQFAAITIASHNTHFKDATVYYYSETPRQGEEYTYWYYGEDGLPCIW